jgi:hypothetical protein
VKPVIVFIQEISTPIRIRNETGKNILQPRMFFSIFLTIRDSGIHPNEIGIEIANIHNQEQNLVRASTTPSKKQNSNAVK